MTAIPRNKVHNICKKCWMDMWGVRRPAQIKHDHSTCCFCGKENTDGIYIISTCPEETPCCKCKEAEQEAGNGKVVAD